MRQAHKTAIFDFSRIAAKEWKQYVKQNHNGLWSFRGSIMNDHPEYKMAIDLLRCHLGLTDEEARQQLGLNNQPLLDENETDLPIGLFFDINK